MAARSRVLPLAIWVIGFGIFAQGTSEVMLSGLLPEMASDLRVSIPQAGWLISAFALGILVGAPIMAVSTLRLPRRPVLVAFVAVFILTHVVSAVADHYALLLAMRGIGAFTYAGFWAVGASTAMSLVPHERRGQAMSIVAGGLTIAVVLGLPAGSWLGQMLGWRSAFWAVAVLCTLAALLLLGTVPAIRHDRPPRMSDELRGIARPRLWVSYAMTATATTALIATYAYLGAMLPTTTGLDRDLVPLALFGYGVGSCLGIIIGGRTAHSYPRAVLGLGFAGLGLCLLLLSLFAGIAAVALPLVFALGLFGFSTNPALNSRTFAIAPAAPTLSTAGNTSAFNIGITAGPWIGGAALNVGWGYQAIPAIGAGIAALALALWAWDCALLSRR